AGGLRRRRTCAAGHGGAGGEAMFSLGVITRQDRGFGICISLGQRRRRLINRLLWLWVAGQLGDERFGISGLLYARGKVGFQFRNALRRRSSIGLGAGDKL